MRRILLWLSLALSLAACTRSASRHSGGDVNGVNGNSGSGNANGGSGNIGNSANENGGVNGGSAISVKDYAGRIVTLERPAARVAVMAGNSLCVLTALDLLPCVAALDAKTHSLLSMTVSLQLRPELQELPNVGKTSSPDYEAILGANPDLILFSGNGQDADNMEYKTGVKTAVIKSLDGYDFGIYRTIARLVGKEERAEEVITELTQRKSALDDMLSAVGERKSAYIVLQSASGNLFKTMKSNQSLDVAHITNCAATGGVMDEWGIVQYSKEAVLALSPDIIFLDKPLSPSAITAEVLREDETFSMTDAVRRADIHIMHSFFLPKDYVYVIAQGYYFASIAYPDIVPHEVYRDAINGLFNSVYLMENYFDEFNAEYR